MSNSKDLAIRLEGEALRILKEYGGELKGTDVICKLGERLEFDEWENFKYPNGNSRWVTIFIYGTTDLVKAGFIIKNKGRWFLTDEGTKAVEIMSDEEIFETAHNAYKAWVKSRNEICEEDTAISEDIAHTGISYIDIKNKADEDIMNYMHERTPYEFQDMVAALLRSMGYYTPFIAPKGKDGGIDIIAYSDPLGATKPILKVQVKHYSLDNPVSVQVIREIVAVSKGDMPIVVTSGRFAEQAKVEARQSNVRLIDGYEFTELWIKYFDKMTEEDKELMPIEPLYFIRRAE